MFRRRAPVCCDGFESLLQSAGERGLGALVVDVGGVLEFRLQSRGVAHRDVVSVARPNINAPERWLNVSQSTGLRFCPFCGVRLERLLRANTQHYQELARTHAHYSDEAQFASLAKHDEEPE